MTDENAKRLIAYSLYPLALGIFVSVSLIPLYQILFFLAFAYLIKKNSISFGKLPRSAWALLVFVFIQLISALVNFSELQDITRALGTLKYPLLGIICLSVFQNIIIKPNDYLAAHAQRAFNLFLFTIILAFTYSVIKVYSGLEYFESYYQAIANETESTRFAGFTETMRYGYGTALAILVLLAYLTQSKKMYFTKTWYLILALATGTAGMYLSYTRGSLLSVLLGIPLVIYFYSRKAAIIASISAFIIVGTMVSISLLGGSENSRLLQKSDSNSNKVRIAQYWAAVYQVKEKPLLGFGPQQFKYHAREMKERYNLGYLDFDSHTHNVFLQFAADSGILGLIAFLGWIFFWFKETLTRGNSFAKQVFFSTILFLLIAGQVEMLFMAQTSTLIYFIYALSGLNIFKKETA